MYTAPFRIALPGTFARGKQNPGIGSAVFSSYESDIQHQGRFACCNHSSVQRGTVHLHDYIIHLHPWKPLLFGHDICSIYSSTPTYSQHNKSSKSVLYVHAQLVILLRFMYTDLVTLLRCLQKTLIVDTVVGRDWVGCDLYAFILGSTAACRCGTTHGDRTGALVATSKTEPK